LTPINSNELSIQPMRRSDLAEVLRLEEECFPHPWTRGMLEEELRRENGAFLVARHWRELVGYAGIIYILEEGHVTNLAVHKTTRRKGVAARLLLRMIEDAAARGIRFLTLEVRRSNQPAIRLYEKFGFTVIGERKRYYLDDDEDALIMWTEDISTPEYRCLLVPIAAALQEKKRGWG
jgi:ribosomal-protein-alanine N-acetyltransferase